MDVLLEAVEVRVLGSLIEKEITTPEYYPMTMNALLNACNQKSNRDPVVAWDEETVAEAIDSLRGKKLVATLTGGGNRVPKYSQRLVETFNLGRREVAVLCELMLRGPETLGELRDRASRMHSFEDTAEVERVLMRLREHDSGALVIMLPRLPGQKEARWMHLLAGEPDVEAVHTSAVDAGRSGGISGAGASDLRARVESLEEEVRALRALVARLSAELGVDAP
jgi:uncharacterized protein